MGDWNQPRHLVLAVSSKIKVMCHSRIFIVFLIQCIPSHLQHNIIECMRGVYVLAKHSSFRSQLCLVLEICYWHHLGNYVGASCDSLCL